MRTSRFVTIFAKKKVKLYCTQSFYALIFVYVVLHNGCTIDSLPDLIRGTGNQENSTHYSPILENKYILQYWMCNNSFSGDN